MQIIRTVIWVLVLVALAAFAYLNWARVDVTIWDGLVLNTPLSALVLASFATGLVPMWAVSKANGWRLKRRIATL